MNIFKKINNYVDTKNEIIHSEMATVFTKYGKFQMKAYKDDHQEYIAIMNQKFFDLERPVVYIHFDVQHSEMDHDMHCYCANQVELALKMIQKSGGLVIYSSREDASIDNLLEDINTRRLDEGNAIRGKSKIKFSVKETIVYPSLAFILSDLKLSNVNLITNDEKVIDIVELLGINILRIEPNISFDYGNKKVAN
ncbi:MAG: GTP cyclohydrolase II [uncultured Sulfurovum sp.]|uniref:GTP cyclohydrolase II n=1 Tax=uncultured Sulfurovum sp. TaxID=269237 RepID=A0A6S6SRW5_9BACT|nr:MAG: GTP cyclohydrolase II [uncultured Sulfurovum sp.]